MKKQKLTRLNKSIHNKLETELISGKNKVIHKNKLNHINQQNFDYIQDFNDETNSLEFLLITLTKTFMINVTEAIYYHNFRLWRYCLRIANIL